jgi:hypothetical protein
MTYHLNQDLNEFSFVSGLDSRKHLSLATFENGSLLCFGKIFELRTSEAGLLEVLARSYYVQLLGNRNRSFLGVASDHDDVDASSSASTNRILNFRTNRVLNADVAYEGTSRL